MNSIKTRVNFSKGFPSLTAKILISAGVPNFGKFITKYYLSQTKFDILTTAVAVKLYESENGRVPDTLQGLVPDYLPEVFSDPFNDFKPLKYTKKNGGWIVYSFGPDKQDDNGSFECENWDKKGDIVFSSINKNGQKQRAIY